MKKVNLKTGITVSDLNDSHIIGVEFDTMRSRIIRTTKGYISISVKHLYNVDYSQTEQHCEKSIKDLINRLKASYKMKAVYVFDNLKELKKWLKSKNTSIYGFEVGDVIKRIDRSKTDDGSFMKIIGIPAVEFELLSVCGNTIRLKYLTRYEGEIGLEVENWKHGWKKVR